MVSIKHHYSIKDLGVFSEYRGCKDVLVWVEIIYHIDHIDSENPEYNLTYKEFMTVDVFKEETFDPTNFISKNQIDTAMIQKWIDENLPQFLIDRWVVKAEEYFSKTIAQMQESKNMSTVDGPWIQHGT